MLKGFSTNDTTIVRCSLQMILHSFLRSSIHLATKQNKSYRRLKNVSIEVFKSYPFDSNIEIQISSLAPVTDFILTTTFFCNSSRDDADFIVSQSSLRCKTLRSIIKKKETKFKSSWQGNKQTTKEEVHKMVSTIKELSKSHRT